MTIMIPAWVAGKLTPVEKLEAHRRGLRHKAVSVFVLRGEQILLQRRALGKYHTPGLWTNTCCTHPHWDETGLDCARRRLDEELGLSGLTLRSGGQVEYRADVGNGLVEHEVVEIFTAQAIPRMTLSPNLHEVMDLRWVTRFQLTQEIAAIPRRFTPWLKVYLANHAHMIFAKEPDVERL